MKKNRKVFILGASSDIGLSIMNIYHRKNYEILAHYNMGNKKFFEYTKNKKNKNLNSIFLRHKQIHNFAKKKILKIVHIDKRSAYIKEISFKNVKIKDIRKFLKLIFIHTYF